MSNRAKDWRECRRFRAWELREKGWTQQRIAESLGVTQGAVSQWLKKAEEGGVETLRNGKRPGAPSRLTPSQKSEIPELLSKGAESYGFRGELWTCERVAEVIRRHYGVSHHPSHVSPILRSLGWSLQKPERRANQRNEDEIREWLEGKWPEIRKKGGAENRTIVFVDQSGFYLLPCVMRTYAPSGKTPEIRAPLSRDHQSAMSGITPDGKLYMQVQDRSYKGEDVACFLKHLLRHIEGKLLVLWDRSPIHRSQAAKNLLVSIEGSRIHL